MNWKGSGGKWLWPILRYYPGICLEELIKTTVSIVCVQTKIQTGHLTVLVRSITVCVTLLGACITCTYRGDGCLFSAISQMHMPNMSLPFLFFSQCSLSVKCIRVVLLQYQNMQAVCQKWWEYQPCFNKERQKYRYVFSYI
jgi:Flp pilus assembly protein protease CpaA